MTFRFKISISGTKALFVSDIKKSDIKRIKDFVNDWKIFGEDSFESYEPIPFVPVSIVISKGKEEFEEYCEFNDKTTRLPSYLPISFLRSKGKKEGTVYKLPQVEDDLNIELQFEQRTSSNKFHLNGNYEDILRQVNT